MPTHPIAAVPNSDSEHARLPGRATILALLVALLALQVRLWTGEASLAEVATLETRVAAQQAENRRLAEQNALLETEVRALK
ncbi:MAG: septum formation initiator family protein, partial [Pseudomonadales bacterium]|nr:septum formation initiator family protein [Pseudomonadales bacterium]